LSLDKNICILSEKSIMKACENIHTEVCGTETCFTR
jgi:hypothetical protein